MAPCSKTGVKNKSETRIDQIIKKKNKEDSFRKRQQNNLAAHKRTEKLNSQLDYIYLELIRYIIKNIFFYRIYFYNRLILPYEC